MKELAIQIKDIIKEAIRLNQSFELIKEVASKVDNDIYKLAARVYLREGNNINNWILRVERIQSESLELAKLRLEYSISLYLMVVKQINS